jgi:ABC-type nitrate/sulfonate/bicarbonate transport system permease component
MEGPGLPDRGVLRMSVVNHVRAGAVAAPARAAKTATPWLDQPALYRYGFVVFIMIVWEIVGPFINPIFFTYPSKIAVAFYDLTISGELPYYLGQSLEVMVYGLSASLVVGIPLGIAMARFRRLDWALDLPINALYATRECDKNMLEVAHAFRSSEWRTWQDVLLPFAVPYIIAGIRLAIGRGLIGMIIAEFYTTISGLGFMITRYANVFEMDKVFVPVIVLMVLGVSLTTLLKWVGRKIAPWSNANR